MGRHHQNRKTAKPETMNASYINTVRLLLDIVNPTLSQGNFAIKGGTAINLFVQDMPRLSVDIDLVFLDHSLDRPEALAQIGKDLQAAKVAIQRMNYVADIKQTKGGDETKMLVSSKNAQVKVEVNFVFRGTVLQPVSRSLTQATQNLFSTDVTALILDVPELYGSKLVAAMDRQHPRDIFDVQQMNSAFGLKSSFVDCFVAYLAGHNRPIHEVLFTRSHPLEQAFKSEFQGMTKSPIVLESLIQTQTDLISSIPHALTKDHKQFLLSLSRAEPLWNLMPFANLSELPAIRWKLMNLEKLKSKNPAQFSTQFNELEARFSVMSNVEPAMKVNDDPATDRYRFR